MKKNDKRKKNRVGISSNQIFIEINQTFGNVKNTVFKVNEIDDDGLSFDIPFSQGFFTAETPIYFSIIEHNNILNSNTGLIKYSYVKHNNFGEKIYRTGLQINQSLKNKLKNKFKQRPVRYLNNEFSFDFTFDIKGSVKHFSIIDISKFGASFLVSKKDSSLFKTRNHIRDIKIFYNDFLFYAGDILVLKKHKELNSAYKVVVAPKKKIFDTRVLFREENLCLVLDNTKDLFLKIESEQKHIDPKFRNAIYDLKYFLTSFKQYLESPKILSVSLRFGDIHFLEKIFPYFFRKFNKHIQHIENVIEEIGISSKNKKTYKDFYQHHLHPLFLLAPLNKRVYQRPWDYPGDFEMMRMIYENKFSGLDLFSKLLNKYSTSTNLAIAGRNRNRYLSKRIATVLKTRKSEKFNILSLACGGVFELDTLFKKDPQILKNVKYTLLEQEKRALEYSQQKIYENNIKFNTDIKIEIIHQNVIDYLKKEKERKYDLIYAFGIFDYFNDKTSKFVIKRLLKLINKNGLIIITNASLENHHHQHYMEYGFDWDLEYRTSNELKKLAENISEIKDYRIIDVSNRKKIINTIEINC